MKPSSTLALDDHVNSDFAGLHHRNPDPSLTSVKSCTGYLITLGDVPLIWKSQLQSKIALYTRESEYSALSQSLCTVILVRSLLLEVTLALGLNADLRSTRL
jgi:hypothetical protein